MTGLLRCTHVVGSIRDASAGTSHSVPALCDALSQLGAEVAIETVAGWRAPSDAGPPQVGQSVVLREHAQSWAHTPILRSLCASNDLKSSLMRSEPRALVIHVHGLWLLPDIYPAGVRKQTGVRLVHSTRGMLGPAALEFARWKKTAFWQLWQKRALKSADCLHATSDAELEEIRASGLTNPVAVIPNGVAMPEMPASPAPLRSERTVLSLGRIHPKKGLDNLIRAWATLENDFPEWRLRLIGPPENAHDEMLRSLKDSLGVKRVHIEGPVFGAERLAAYRSADLFILPSRNENFAMTVAEALAAAIPVISTKGAPWGKLEEKGCGWWIDHGPAALASQLRAAMVLPRSELTAMGQKGRTWMAAEFSWDSVASRMLDVYRWITAGEDRPVDVRLAPKHSKDSR